MAEASPAEKLTQDLQTLIGDVEALLKATATQAGETVNEARTRAEESLRNAKERLADAHAEGLEDLRALAGNTELYVRDNPWQSLALAAGAGIVLGVLLSRR